MHSEQSHELQKLRPNDVDSQEAPAEERPTPMMPTGGNERHHYETRAAQPLTGRDEDDQSTQLNKRVVRKLDTILLPFLAVLFLLNSLDKSNIGNAETAGFTVDTGLSRNDINTSMSVFFFVFVLLQPIGAGLGRRFGMQKFVPICMSLWGMGTLLHIHIRKRWHLILLRAVIAVLESGFYPTTVSYMSLFYTKYEFAVRLGFFYGMIAVSGCVGGILSWAVFSEFPGHDDEPKGPGLPPSVQQVKGAVGWKSWEILFLIEGCLTMTIALMGFLWLPRSAGSAWFLNREERQWAESRMRADTYADDVKKEGIDEDADDGVIHHERTDSQRRSISAGDEAHERLLSESGPTEETTRKFIVSAIPVTKDAGLTRHEIVAAFYNYKIWHILICNILSAIPATAFGVLLPILVKDLSPSLNLTPAASNLLSAPPFAFGAVVMFIFVAWSDRTRRRLVPILWGLVLLLAGLTMAVLAPVDNYWLRYISLCVLLSGSFIASPLTVAWLANNTPEPGKRAILLGINGWGSLAGVFMVLLFTPEDQAEGYVRPFFILLICVFTSLAGFIGFHILIVRENRWRHTVLRSWSEEEKEREDLLGDVPAPDTARERFAKRLGLLTLARKLGLEESRNGDERLTFRYSL